MRIICREDSWYSTERVTWVVKSLSVRLCLSVERDRYRPPVFANITAPNTILATNSAFWPISLLESCPHNTNNLNYRYPFVTSLLSFWLGVQKRVVVPAKKVNHLSSSIMFELLSISPSSVLELDSVPSSSTCSSDIFGTKAWGGCDPRICFVLFSFFFFGGGGGAPCPLLLPAMPPMQMTFTQLGSRDFVLLVGGIHFLLTALSTWPFIWSEVRFIFRKKKCYSTSSKGIVWSESLQHLTRAWILRWFRTHKISHVQYNWGPASASVTQQESIGRINSKTFPWVQKMKLLEGRLPMNVDGSDWHEYNHIAAHQRNLNELPVLDL